jgi:nicotinamidase-related amidase
MNTALLVLDVQPTVLVGYPPHKQSQVLDRAGLALSFARAQKIAVVFARLGFRAGTKEVSPRNRLFSRVAALENFDESNPLAEIHQSLGRRTEEAVLVKRRASAFSGTDLALLLRAREVTHLVLAGVATSGSVLSTLRDAADQDYELTVLADACTDHDDQVHELLCAKVFPLQATVMTVEEWMDGRMRVSPAFAV